MTNKQSGYDNIIKKHYDSVAEKEGSKTSSTMADNKIRSVETSFILDTISDFVREQRYEHKINGDNARGPGGKALKIVDVGCGNGTTLKKLSEKISDAVFFGVEQNDKMREVAVDNVPSEIELIKGDIRIKSDIPEDIDVLVCQRVLINLLNEEDQDRAMNNLYESVSEGGLMIFIECFESGLDNLNSARREFGLEEIGASYHNK